MLVSIELGGVLFKGCNIEKISVLGAKWLKTVFKTSNLTDIVFDGEFVDCAFEGLKPSRIIFRDVTFKNTFFKNCNLKKLCFENCKADSLTLAFLKNNKADISEIIPIERKS